MSPSNIRRKLGHLRFLLAPSAALPPAPASSQNLSHGQVAELSARLGRGSDPPPLNPASLYSRCRAEDQRGGRLSTAHKGKD